MSQERPEHPSRKKKPKSIIGVFRNVGKLHGFTASGKMFTKPIGNDLLHVVWVERSYWGRGHYVEIGLALKPQHENERPLGSVKTRIPPKDPKLAYTKSSLEESGAKVAESSLIRLAEWAFTFVQSSWPDERAIAIEVLRDDFVTIWNCSPYLDIKEWAARKLAAEQHSSHDGTARS